MQKIIIGFARATLFHRGLFRPFISRIVFLLGRGKPVDVPFRGSIFRLEGGPNLIEQGIMLHPRYNQTDIDFLIDGLKDDGVFIDIGSNIGLYTLPIARKLQSKGRVVAIDANPQMAENLKRNAKLSELTNILILSVAVSNVSGHANLAVRKNDDAIVRIDETESGEISVSTLMDIVSKSDVKRIDALKIDIEGHEDKALAPFIETVPDSLLPGRIVIECVRQIGDYPACAAAFLRRGYTLKGRTRNNSLYAL